MSHCPLIHRLWVRKERLLCREIDGLSSLCRVIDGSCLKIDDSPIQGVIPTCSDSLIWGHQKQQLKILRSRKERMLRWALLTCLILEKEKGDSLLLLDRAVEVVRCWQWWCSRQCGPDKCGSQRPRALQGQLVMLWCHCDCDCTLQRQAWSSWLCEVLTVSHKLGPWSSGCSSRKQEPELTGHWLGW